MFCLFKHFVQKCSIGILIKKKRKATTVNQLQFEKEEIHCYCCMMTKMNTSTPKSSTRSKISLVQKRGTRLSSLFKNLSPLPKLVRDLFVLSFKVTFSIVISSIRLVIPPSKKSLLGETVLVRKEY